MRRTGLAHGQGMKLAVSSAPKARKVFVSHPRAGRRALLRIPGARLPRARWAFWWVIFREQTWVTSRERRSPRRERTLPRPLLPEQDQRIQQELIRRDDLASNLLLLQRHTGMRIGECVDLAADCLRPIGPDQWAIHVPLGKLKKERLVPVDSFVCQIIRRLLSLRSQSDSNPGGFLLPRLRSRETLIRRLRAAFRDAVAAAGITTRLVPHQNRHTYASEMLRAGVSLTGVMELLGHNSPEMTLLYLEI